MLARPLPFYQDTEYQERIQYLSRSPTVKLFLHLIGHKYGHLQLYLEVVNIFFNREFCCPRKTQDFVRKEVGGVDIGRQQQFSTAGFS